MLYIEMVGYKIRLHARNYCEFISMRKIFPRSVKRSLISRRQAI